MVIRRRRCRVRWPGNDELKSVRIGYFEDDGRTPVTRKRAPL
jgi:hypothetical protein